MRMSALFGAKTSDFSKFLICPHGQGKGVNFSRFCANVFYGRSLTICLYWGLILIKNPEIK